MKCLSSFIEIILLVFNINIRVSINHRKPFIFKSDVKNITLSLQYYLIKQFSYEISINKDLLSNVKKFIGA